MVDAPQTEETRRMQADALLPPPIRPLAPLPDRPPRTVLLTGACGFLGRYVAREVLGREGLRLLCLIRPRAGRESRARLEEALAPLGIGRERLRDRVEILEGDVSEPRFGLDATAYSELAKRVDLILHGAAVVDWLRSYRQLKRTNVDGVMEVIRLAARGTATRIVFVSSIAVGYGKQVPERVDERTDMLPYVGQMPLGYAQSKCVAEGLLRNAAGRGIPVTVVRPALIAGDSVSGDSNPEDFLAALIQGCINTGMAIDTDWRVDCVPVDFVARVITAVPQGRNPYQVLNLVHPKSRHWRELVLWMNLHGYPMDLVDEEVWVDRQFNQRHAQGTLIYRLRRFFRGDGHPGEEAPYKSYLNSRQQRIDSSATYATLNRFGLEMPPLNSERLHAYFRDYRACGLLRPVGEERNRDERVREILGGPWRSGFFGQPRLSLTDVGYQPVASDSSILNEMASARPEGGAGLWRVRFKVEGEAVERFQGLLKIKVKDTLIHDQTVQLARLCQPKLGRLFETFHRRLGLTGSHERELALYETEEPRLRRYMPICYGTQRCPNSEDRALLLEYLPEAEKGGQSSATLAASRGLNAILSGLAQIHSVWYGREEALRKEPWLYPRLDVTRMVEMTELWRTLADFSGVWFREWCGPEIGALQARFIDSLPQWWPRLYGMPVTLIHNDFNPRNLVLRGDSDALRLCAYDWELATAGVPQHDLAELLCFIWQPGMDAALLETLLETHRLGLAEIGEWAIDKEAWREGFVLSLRHLLLNRLATYTLIHRFRPQSYLPRVLRNWMKLYRWTDGEIGEERALSADTLSSGA